MRGTKIEASDSAVALVLPSIADHVEVYSIVTSEAWARERPVIASKVGEMPYRVRQGVNGLLVDPSDPKALAEAMARLVEDEELAEEMGKNGRREVFSWREIAEKSVQLYEQVLRGG
jgi:glycosyltransferase involved in cell wall biosynthesis